MNNAQYPKTPLPLDYPLRDGDEEPGANARYTLKGELDSGGFGITYKAWDAKLEGLVAIKEYMPRGTAFRNPGEESVQPEPRCEKKFEAGKEDARKEARNLHKFDSLSHIVNVKTFFEENNTVYISMSYVEGKRLSDYIEDKGEGLTEAQLKNILAPLLNVLKKMNVEAYIHADITPANIIIKEDKDENNSSVLVPMLIDFGTANHLISTKIAERAFTSGYAPIELYDPSFGEPTFRTDIYGLAAVCYYALTGESPPDAWDRERRLRKFDPLSNRFKDNDQLSQQFLRAIDHALQLSPKDRPETVDDWRVELFPPTEPKPEPKPQIEIPEPEPEPEPQIKIEPLITKESGLIRPEGIALDVKNNTMYWTDSGTKNSDTDSGTGKIQCANLKDKKVEFVITELKNPVGIALDVERGKMYWTDYMAQTIECATLKGEQRHTLFTKKDGLKRPWGIALDVKNGKIYWTDYVAQKIQCAKLDGSQDEPEDVITKDTKKNGLKRPWGIALDVKNNKMYWTDKDLKEETAEIWCATLEGEKPERLITKESGLSSPKCIALDVEHKKMYWTDEDTQEIQCATLEGKKVEPVFTEESGLSKPWGIALDVGRGKVYWTDVDAETKMIQCAVVPKSPARKDPVREDEDRPSKDEDPKPPSPEDDVGETKPPPEKDNVLVLHPDNGDNKPNGSNKPRPVIGRILREVGVFLLLCLFLFPFVYYFMEQPSGSPDLIVEEPSVSGEDRDFFPGDSFTLYVKVRNQGKGPSASRWWWWRRTMLHYYFSSDSTISTHDTELYPASSESRSVSRLSASDETSKFINLTIPLGIKAELDMLLRRKVSIMAEFQAEDPEKTFYVGACVDSVSGESNTANNCSNGKPINLFGDHGDSLSSATDHSWIISRRFGRIKPGGDVDYFKVPVSSPGTLTVYTTGNTNTHGTLLNVFEKPLETNDDGGSDNNFFIARPVRAGLYYIAVKGSSQSETGSYILHVYFGSPDP